MIFMPQIMEIRSRRYVVRLRLDLITTREFLLLQLIFFFYVLLWLCENPIFFYIQGIIYVRLCVRHSVSILYILHTRVSLPYANAGEGRLIVRE